MSVGIWSRQNAIGRPTTWVSIAALLGVRRRGVGVRTGTDDEQVGAHVVRTVT